MASPRPGYYGPFGGRFVAETLVPALDELTHAFHEIVLGAAFQREWRALLASYVGRPTPLGEAQRLARAIDPDGTRPRRLWLKREDLCHTGAHKINNALGQVLLAKQMGKTRIIAETGAGQHGVATATACALFGLPCEVYMGEEDVKRQAPNVGRMKLLGARVSPGPERVAHAEGRDERGAARLGHQRAHDALLHRQRRRAAPLPRARGHLPERHRRGGARAVSGAAAAPSPTRPSRASAAARTRSGSSAAS